MKKFRKKPVEIEAMQFSEEGVSDVLDWIRDNGGPVMYTHKPPADLCLDIVTLEGVMTANVGDWIIRGVAGEFYPCRGDIFVATYEEVQP